MFVFDFMKENNIILGNIEKILYVDDAIKILNQINRSDIISEFSDHSINRIKLLYNIIKTVNYLNLNLTKSEILSFIYYHKILEIEEHLESLKN